MLLKYISIPELNFSESWDRGLKKIKNLNNFDKYMTIFWFLGPIIYLIERSPADLWLSLIGIIFLFRCLLKRDWSWTSQKWFRLALGLWIFGLFSAILSVDPYFSLSQGLVWIRFPLYAAAAQVWLAKDRDIRVMMLIFLLFGALIMSLILITETLHDPKPRLTWPYGDLIPGSYISKTSLPIICVLVAIISSQKKISPIITLILSITFLATLLTGERMSLILLTGGLLTSALFFKPQLKKIFLIILSIFIIFLSTIFFKPQLFDRFTNHFFKSIPIFNTTNNVDTIPNPYWGAWRGGIEQGLLTPIKGIGPSSTRKTCKDLKNDFSRWLPGKNFCSNHPHNFYIQIFAETGLVGLVIGILMFLSIIITCYKARYENLNCPMAATSFIMPFLLFFPLQQFGSFYGQWGNLFIWFAIGFSISQYQGWRSANKSFEK
tara:strand:- start:728 stop:2032 length:1305 start_codon:yes stop_codon:yes gene_type:complete